ncbi:hypothetical protein TSUD_270650 [Trifolium subterraneum]|uniref:Dirigent protein n=1 Tax=Trifolium subterraneum TaxID=3900 RepID=A0A2Z6N6X4_TRISU|nr:hypothetical protein TSUD_270650 [Trifolium subterraneum]
MAPTFSTPIKLMSFSILFFLIINIVNAQQSNLVYYLQDIGKGNNPTVATVIGINGRVWSYNTFGTIFVVDDPVLLEPSPLSTQVGKAQGVITVTSIDGANVNIVLSLVFNDVQYGRSTLQIQGSSHQRDNLRELSVIGGTGRFRFARGYVVFETVSYDPTNNHSVIKLAITLSIP